MGTTNAATADPAGASTATAAECGVDVVLIGAVVGGVLGALLLAGLVALIVAKLRAKRRNAGAAPTPLAPTSSAGEYGDVAQVRASGNYASPGNSDAYGSPFQGLH